MAKAKAPPEEDEAQSRRFLELARELEAAGELSPTEDESAFKKLFEKAVTPKKRAPFAS